MHFKKTKKIMVITSPKVYDHMSMIYDGPYNSKFWPFSDLGFSLLYNSPTPKSKCKKKN